MKKILAVLPLVLVFAACTTKSGEISSENFSGSVVKYQYGHMTYLVFDKGNGGVAIVNYTADSLEYEFLHSSTKSEFNEPDSTILDHSELKKVR